MAVIAVRVATDRAGRVPRGGVACGRCAGARKRVATAERLMRSGQHAVARAALRTIWDETCWPDVLLLEAGAIPDVPSPAECEGARRTFTEFATHCQDCARRDEGAQVERRLANRCGATLMVPGPPGAQVWVDEVPLGWRRSRRHVTAGRHGVRIIARDGTHGLETIEITRLVHHVAPRPEAVGREALEPGGPAPALIRYHQGRGLYGEGLFKEAAEAFQVAFALFPASTKLPYNLARALEGAGDREGARINYSKYLDKAPDADDAPEVRAVLAALANAGPSTPAANRRGASEPEPSAQQALEADANGADLWPWIGGGTMALGVAAAVVGGIYWSKAADTSAEGNRLPPGSDAEAGRLQSRLEDERAIAWTGLGIGGVLVAGGLAILLWPRRSGQPVAFDVDPLGRSATLTWLW
ncbi:MAG: hypothetical protein H6704_07070 [Myxococcales bacterium]|nr:hypothetical protein [Myxococcales bacterium]